MTERLNIEDWQKGILINQYKGDTIQVEMAYHRNNEIKYIEVGICDVRAADNIRISYDFDRDGYIVEQSYINEIQKEGYIDAATDIWEEVGFFPAWNLEEKGTKIGYPQQNS